ncbi:MAG TPA: hypothetical protein VMH23_02875, partial [Bacteroidota bacterium]|nr:hypothetical protein [Bacteroidota bacterium]
MRLFRAMMVLTLIIVAVHCASAQDASSKTGGVCFRVDDNHEGQWFDYANLFAAQGFKITIALNPGTLVPGYVNSLKAFLVSAGHEIADHTPNHSTFYFTSDNSSKYLGTPGVDHIHGDTIFLAIDHIDTTNAQPGELLMNVRNGIGYVLRNSIPGDLRVYPVLGLYSPEKKLFLRVTNQNLPGSSVNKPIIGLSTAWSESFSASFDSVRFRAVHFFDVHMKNEAVKLLVTRSLDLFRQYALPAPTTWIQPGGSSPYLPAEQMQPLGHTSTATYPTPALKCFNEFNPAGDRQFAMQCDIDLDTISVKDFKRTVANAIARHFCIIGLTHLSSAAASQTAWETYLSNITAMLAWCKQANVPVMTQRTMTGLLYNSVQDPHVNVFPSLAVDRDGDGNPDGFTPADGALRRDDGVPESGGVSFALHSSGTFCRVRDLAGLEKSENEFSIWTRGEVGDSVSVIITLHSKTDIQKVLRFPATTSFWNRYSSTIVIPQDVTTCDVAISANVAGPVAAKISGMFLAKENDQLDVAGTVVTSGNDIPVGAVTVAISRTDVSPNIITTLTSNANGVFSTTPNKLRPGTYSFKFSKSGGHPTVYANASDALQVALYSVNTAAHPLNALQKLAADVNNDGVINSADALQIVLRYVGLVGHFAKGDWVIVPDTSDLTLTTMDEMDNAVAMAVGDVNGDAIPESVYFAKVNGTPSVEAGIGPALKIGTSDSFEIPVRVKAGVNLGSMSFAFRYPVASAEFEGVRGPDGMVSAANDGIVKIAWFSVDHPLELKENDAVLVLRFKPLREINNFSLTLDPNSQVTDAAGTVLPRIRLEIPEADASIPEVFALGQNYPNPFNPSTAIKYQLPRAAYVSLKIFNSLGQLVTTLVDEKEEAGYFNVNWNAANIPS